MSVKLMQNLVKDLETELDFKLDKTQITNCITEIPQDIKLELNDGVLTLKAGSKLHYYNNGWTTYTVSIDQSRTITTTGTKQVVVFAATSNGSLQLNGLMTPDKCGSGATTPTDNSFQSFFNTTENQMYYNGSNSWTQWSVALPIAIVTVSDGTITSIDQVFNGFGYIGSTVFALPGVKGLIPDGRNADGSLKNREYTIPTVLTGEGYGVLGSYYFRVNANGGIGVRPNTDSTTQPASTSYQTWYNPEDNFIYRNEGAGTAFKEEAAFIAGSVDCNADKTITSLTPKLPFRAVDNSSLSQDFNQPSVYSIPSTKAVDETAAAIQIADRIYQGVDLTKKFSSEISHYSDVWAWIQARIKAGNFKGIHVGDYIPFQTTAGTVSTNSITALTYNAQIAGIDTYYGYGDTAIAHHIDFITKEVVPVEIKWNPTDNNNGTSTEQHPWLSSAAYAWLNGVNNYSTSAYNNVAHGLSNEGKGMISRLPTSLQNVIITKRQLLEKRYSASGLLTSSNGWDWCNMGKLWLPHEIEVYGCQVWSAAFPDTSVQAWASMGAVQYPLFACTGGKSHNRIKPLAGQSGTRSTWWLSAVHGGTSTHVCVVNNHGHASSYVATQAGIRVPLCFRIA